MIPKATDRLSFRHFNKDDWEAVLKLNSDPRVMTYFPEIKSPAEIQLDFKKYLTYHLQRPGYGYWYTSLKERSEFVGFFLVKILPETGETEIGYRLLPEFWGQGLASEGAKSMVSYAFTELRVKKIVGVTDPDNHASRRVLEKAGLEFRCYNRFYQVRCAYYSIEKE